MVLRGHEGVVYAVAISPDNHWLVTTGRWDKTARLWDLRAKDPALTRRNQNGISARNSDRVTRGKSLERDVLL